MNNLAAIQKAKVSQARTRIPADIMEFVRKNSGIITRQACLDHIANIINLTKDERDATHQSKEKNICNYYETVVSYELFDIKSGKYPKLHLEGDKDGLWMTDEVIPAYDEMIEIIRQVKLAAKSKKELELYAKKQLSEYFRSLPKAIRKRNSKIVMRSLIQKMVVGHLSAANTIDPILV